MVSFDVVSIFMSISEAFVVEPHSDLLHQNYDEGGGQPTAQHLAELADHCLKTFFTFEGVTNEQVTDTLMGSPTSGLTAEGALRKLERRLSEEYKPSWTRRQDRGRENGDATTGPKGEDYWAAIYTTYLR
nr:unnamed protein product [Spirometra erinaceieuropaei]